MSIAPLAEPLSCDLLPADLSADEDVRMQVWGLLAAMYPQTPAGERRRERRYPFPHLIRLTPVAADGRTPCGESIVVVGKHLSERGLGFYHAQPLPYRKMIAAVESPNGQWLSFLVDLNWCRFTKHGWYETGGRLLAATEPP